MEVIANGKHQKWKVVDSGSLVTIMQEANDKSRLVFTKDAFNDICTAIDDYKKWLANDPLKINCRHPKKYIKKYSGTPYDSWGYQCTECGHELTDKELKRRKL